MLKTFTDKVPGHFEQILKYYFIVWNRENNIFSHVAMFSFKDIVL